MDNLSVEVSYTGKGDNMLRKSRIFAVVFLAFSIIAFVGYKIRDSYFVDHIGPKITMKESTIHINCADGDEAILQGITAKDNKDGDVTNRLIIESKSNFIEKGRLNVTIAAFDKDNNVTKTTREVIYDDYQSPTIRVNEDLNFLVVNDAKKLTGADILKKITANDMLDGDITQRIRLSVESSIIVTKTGSYPARLTVTNKYGDVVTRDITVHIYDYGEPVEGGTVAG